MRILVTGSGGRIGHRLITLLTDSSFEVTALSRSYKPHLEEADDYILENLSPSSDFDKLLGKVGIVIHLADGFNAYEDVLPDDNNEEAELRLKTLKTLAKVATQKEIKFIYLSTIKSFCGTFTEELLTEETKPAPQSLYGVLKRTAEDIILAQAKKHNSTAVILQFPIVFGPDIGGNIERLIDLANKPLPLPFKGLDNKRSLISAESLIDAIITILNSDIKGQHSFLLHDGSLTIAEILDTIIDKSTKKRAYLFSMPSYLWTVFEVLPVVGHKVQRFTKPLELDDTKFRTRFKWQPPTDLKISLQRTAKALKSGSKYNP